jgi:osmotically-inducible protein OsmY
MTFINRRLTSGWHRGNQAAVIRVNFRESALPCYPGLPENCVAEWGHEDRPTASRLLMDIMQCGRSGHGKGGERRGPLAEAGSAAYPLFSRPESHPLMQTASPQPPPTVAQREAHAASTLAIRPADVPDAELQHAVACALADDPATDDYQVHVLAHHGVLTLCGLVQSRAERQLVLRVVQGVRGVRSVVAEQLMVSGGTSLNSDAEITSQIREWLDWDVRVNGALVAVRTHEQVVHLSGTVGSAAEKYRLIGRAYRNGATRVDARDLFVAYWALGREIQREKFAPKTDVAIRAAVRAALRFNPRVRSAETLVQVLDGVVTLAGTVGNLRTRQDAEQDARHVVGVANVHNLLKVRPAQLISDQDLRQTITAALARDPYVGHRVFGVQVHGGQALLTGRVDTHFEREHAGEVASGVCGVVNVNNQLDVVGAAAATGPELSLLNSGQSLAARTRTGYCCSAGLPDQAVPVRVVHGRATRTGTVDTWSDRQRAGLPAAPRINYETALKHGIEE